MIKENGKYRILMSLYWMLFCIGYGYVTYFLASWNFSAGEIGVITAMFGALAAVIQPIIGRLADRGGKTGWKPLLLMLAVMECGIALGLYFIQIKIVAGIFYGLFLMLLSCMMPLVNSASFYYQNQGKHINFGVARGLGSLGYAVTSMIIGRLTALAGFQMVAIGGLIIGILFVAAILWMPYDGVVAILDERAAERKKDNKTGFLRRYPAFTRILIGCVGLLTFHNITNTYLLQLVESVGGDSSNMGTALAIAAVLELPVMFGFTYLSRKISAGNLLVIAGISFMLKGFTYLLASNVWWMYLAQIFQMTSFALFASASVYYANECMEPEDKVKGQAYMSSTITIGAVVGNLIGGWMVDGFGPRAMLICAIAVAFAGTLTIFSARKTK